MTRPKNKLTLYATKQAEADIFYWQSTGNTKIVDRINRLISAALENPGLGLGKPERLKFQSVETYSRRIDRTHRLVYRVEDNKLIILAARFHYADN